MAERNGECQVLFCGLVQPQSEDALFRRCMLRRSRGMRFSVLMRSRLTVRTFTEWFWLHAFMICLHLFEIWRLLNSELDPMIWLWLMCKESLLGNLDAWNQRNMSSQEIAIVCCEQIFEEVIVSNMLAEISSLSEEVFPLLFIFISHQSFVLYNFNEYKLKARNNFQFKAYITNHVVLCFIL